MKSSAYFSAYETESLASLEPLKIAGGKLVGQTD